MIKILLTLFILSIEVFAMEMDVETLQNIVDQDSTVIKERVLLAKYYAKNENNLKALSLVEEVLELEPKNSYALSIKHNIETKERVKSIFREAGLSAPINTLEAQKRLDSYYSANNYQFYSNLYQALVDTDVTLDDNYHVKAAYIYLWDARYKQSQKALDELKQTNNLDSAKIRAEICYYTGKYNCAVRLYEKLYNSSYSIDIAIKLINSYIYLGQMQKAERLYNFVYRRYPNNKDLSKLGEKIDISKKSYLLNLKKAYEANQDIDTLSAYSNALFAANKREEAVNLVSKYNETQASNASLVLQAKYLIWMGKTAQAQEMLNNTSLKSDLSAKLMLGQLYSWEQKFEESKRNLDEVIEKTDDKDLLYDAKKARAYVYMWEKESKTAKQEFKKLLKEKPSDKEVKEALMELNHNYAGLIKLYRGRNSLSEKKRLAELYTLNKQSSMAIKYMKEYVEAYPNDLEATKTLGVMLVENKEFYQGFGFLEYYAAQKQTAKSSILLAKNYYWNGFSKEALDVLEALLKKEPKNEEALKLKAKILKISPRFTTSNSGATTGTYFNDLAKKQLFLADTLYFNTHYKAAIPYYENYLRSHPNDHDARYRYAFALENAKEYGKAEGEFSLIFWSKDSDELRYHYAYNMMKNGKLKESKKLFIDLKEKVYKNLDPNLNKFLDSWKGAWQSLDYSNYSAYYDVKFLEDERWAYKKQNNFASFSYISIGIYNPVYKKLDKDSYEIKFYQEYSSNKSSDKGYKVLNLKCAENKTECRITKERWEEGEYKKELLLTPYIDKSLKENAYLKAHPLALNSKKKSLYLKLNQRNIMIFT